MQFELSKHTPKYTPTETGLVPLSVIEGLSARGNVLTLRRK